MSEHETEGALDGLLDLAGRARQVLLESGNCAQATFTVLQERFDLDGGQVLRALTPLPGVALRGETCGAVMGALMALGLVYGRHDLNDWLGYLRSLPPARRFCARFEEINGDTECSVILHQKLGRSFDLADREQAIEYAAAGGPQVCGEVVANAVALAAEEIGAKMGSARVRPRRQASKRQDHEPPAAIEAWGWRYHHLGVPTAVARPGERYLERFKMFVTGFESSPYGIEWMRFEEDSPVSELVRTVPHLAFEVDDLEAALAGKQVLTPPASPSDGVTVAMIIHDGAPVELLQFERKTD